MQESDRIGHKKNSHEIAHFQVLLLSLSARSSSAVPNANDC